MKKGKFLVVILTIILLTVDITPAQSQIKTEKSETVDSSKIATKAFNLINVPDPTFKPFQPPPMDSIQISDMGFDQVSK